VFTKEEGTYGLEVTHNGAVRNSQDGLRLTQNERFDVQIDPDWRMLGPENEDNSFDEAGYYHNLLLEYHVSGDFSRQSHLDTINAIIPRAVALGAVESGEETKAYVLAAFAAEAAAAYGDNPPTQWDELIQWLNDQLTKTQQNLPTDIEEGRLQVPDRAEALDFLANLEIDDSLGHIWDTWMQIDRIVQNLEDSADVTRDGLNDAMEELRGIEDQVKASFSGDEEQALLMLGSVARHSTAYWGSDLSDDDSGWDIVMAANGRWKRIVGKDLVGGLTGFLGGGWVGGLVGAAVSSIDEALDED